MWDSELPIHIVEQDIFISVVNINDAAPVCTPAVNRVEVAEDRSVGGTLLTLACTDPDTPNLRYSFVDQSVSKFQLNQRSELSLKGEPGLGNAISLHS